MQRIANFREDVFMKKTKSKKAKKVSYQIPFDSKGNMCKYSHDTNIVEWRDPEPFEDTLYFLKFERGRSAAHAIFEAEEGPKTPRHGITFQVFLTDLADMMQHFVSDGRTATITGRFTFCKRGQNFGVKLVEALD
jgi:hypothetical protein